MEEFSFELILLIVDFLPGLIALSVSELHQTGLTIDCVL